MKFLSSIALFAAAASAYKVSTPTLNSTVVKGTSLDVQWSSVDTDADTFSLYLVNFQTAHWPPTVLSLAQNIGRDLGSLKVRIPCDLSSDYGWQLNFINGTNTYVIYAQSPVFSLSGDCVEPKPTPTPAKVWGSNSTVTATVVQTVVQTVSIDNPVVWFVQPTNLVSAAAMCPPAAVQTVTVYQGAQCSGGAPVPSGPAYGNKTTTAGSKTTPMYSASTGFVKSSSLSVFTGAAAANGVGGGFAALLLGAVAMML